MTLEQRNDLIIKYIPLANKIAKSKYQKFKDHSISFDEIKSASYMGLVDAANKFKDNLNCSFFTYAQIRICGEIYDYIKNLKKDKIKNIEVLDNLYEHNHCDDNYNNIDFCSYLLSFLNLNCKEIIKMYYIQNKSMKEIGDILNLSESRISQLISKSKKIMRKKMKLSYAFIMLIICFCSISKAQTAIPVPLENKKMISGTNAEFHNNNSLEKAKNLSEMEEYKNLVWNKLDTKNFIILSIDKNHGFYIKNNIENIKTWILERWGISDIDFSAPCKIICVSNKDLLVKLFKIDKIRHEVRKNEEGKILLNIIWLSSEDIDHIAYNLSHICFSELEQNKNKKLPPHIKAGMCFLNKKIDSIKSEIKNLKDKVDYQNIIKQKEADIINYEKECGVLCLLLRKEFGQYNFLNYISDNNLSKNFGTDDPKILHEILNKYLSNLLKDLQENKVPNDYLDVRRK